MMLNTSESDRRYEGDKEMGEWGIITVARRLPILKRIRYHTHALCSWRWFPLGVPGRKGRRTEAVIVRKDNI